MPHIKLQLWVDASPSPPPAHNPPLALAPVDSKRESQKQKERNLFVIYTQRRRKLPLMQPEKERAGGEGERLWRVPGLNHEVQVAL